jgi:hypothetical protein
VDVLDQHQVERGVLLVVAPVLRVLERDVERLVPQARDERQRDRGQQRGEDGTGDERATPAPPFGPG